MPALVWRSLLLLLALRGAFALRHGPAALDQHSWPGAGSGRAIVTYVGANKQEYIDGAVMLGRSLVRLLLPAELWCVVQNTIPPKDKRLLQAAGWRLREVEPWLPENWVKSMGGHWQESYNKLDVFQLPFKRVVYLDADCFVFGQRSDMLKLLNGEMKPGEIKMVKDVNGFNYNSGVMVFTPDLKVFHKIRSVMATSGGLDQPVVNEAFEGSVTELPSRYNVHYDNHNVTDVVIAHFTGLAKPAKADAQNLKVVRGGAEGLQVARPCPSLYIRYFKELHRQYHFLSPRLKKLLSQPEFGPATAGTPAK